MTTPLDDNALIAAVQLAGWRLVPIGVVGGETTGISGWGYEIRSPTGQHYGVQLSKIEAAKHAHSVMVGEKRRLG